MTMPRRAFLVSSAAAIAAPVAIAAPLMPAAPDAVFGAIDAFRHANAAWLKTLEACAAADRALQAENAFGVACLRLPLAGRQIELTTHGEISAFLDALRAACLADGIPCDDMADVAQGMRDELDAERQRVEMVRSKVNADMLEARQETACDLAGRRASAVLAMVPTTLPGLHAFADLMAEMAADECFLNHQEDTSCALATLATACRNLMPAA